MTEPNSRLRRPNLPRRVEDRPTHLLPGAEHSPAHDVHRRLLEVSLRDDGGAGGEADHKVRIGLLRGHIQVRLLANGERGEVASV